MLINKIGEFGLIKRFRSSIKLDSSVVIGSGDDCAVLAFDKNRYQLFTCDMIVEGEDFTKKDDPYLIGRKALAVSISDIAACGGIPRYCVVSLGIPKNTTVNYIDKVSRGIFELAREYKINVAGGDVSKAGQLVIDVSILGIVEKKCLVLRKGAKAGDVIFVSGELGGSISGKHLRFIPRIKESRYLVSNFKINSMIDISDGLTQDLGHILEKSNTGAIIYERLLPISKRAKGLNDALSGGEDFELLFTASHKEAIRIMARGRNQFKPIGEIKKKQFGLKLLNRANRIIKIKPKGFRHF